MEKLDLSEFSPRHRFYFVALMQVALKMKEEGGTEEFFVNFAKGIWESMELNDPVNLEQALNEFMMDDLRNMVAQS